MAQSLRYGCVVCRSHGDARLYSVDEVWVENHYAYCAEHAPLNAKKLTPEASSV